MARTKQSEICRHYDQRWKENHDMEKLRAFEEQYITSKMQSVVYNKAASTGKEINNNNYQATTKKMSNIEQRTNLRPKALNVLPVADKRGKKNIKEREPTCGQLCTDVQQSDEKIEAAASSSIRPVMLKWSNSQTLDLIRAIKAQKENANLNNYDKSKAVHWIYVAGVINPNKAGEDDTFHKKCRNKFDELKRRHKRNCPDDCDFFEYLIGEYKKREVKRGKLK